MTLRLILGIIILVYSVEILLFLRFIINKTKHKKGKPELSGKKTLFIHFVAITGILCFLYGYFIEPYWIEVKNVDILTNKFKNTTLKIVQISDLHTYINTKDKNDLATIINPLKPDIIVFTGDTLSKIQALPLFKNTMKRLKADIGKYAVLGNYDIWNWHYLDLFGNTGFKLLNEENIRLKKRGEVFYISGLTCAYPDKYYDVLKNIPKNVYSVFLYHYPDLIESLKSLNVDLYLAGHTHGGQVALPFYGALVTLSEYGKKYESGQYKVGKTILYVNRGIGTEAGAPVRFWARPEITVFNIRPKK